MIKAWWLGTASPCGAPHEWQARVKSQAGTDRACPVCTGKKPCACTSLAARHPQLMQDWDWEATLLQGLHPGQLLPTVGKRAAWKCSKCACKWTALVRSRTRGPSKCPACRRAAAAEARASRLCSG